MNQKSCLGLQKLMSVLLLVFFSTKTSGQVSINGAQCVLTTLVYQYDIKGVSKENDKISICVEGGLLVETGTSCIEKNNLSLIRLKWSEGKTTGKITVKTSAGTVNMSVNIVSPFNPGFIETTEKQTIAYNKLPSSLSGTQASGGNCSPSFSYQWEQSSNRVKWIPINGANGRNLSFVTPLKESAFFRRKVFESKSQTIGYSNSIAVFVIPKKS